MSNPTQPTTALLKPLMAGVYERSSIYDPTWTNTAAYNAYQGQRIVPAVGSIVRDVDNTGLWVSAVDRVTMIPTYQAVTLGDDNENVNSLLNWGNSVLRLYTDYRKAPYTATPDSKCIFIGKSPRFYTLSRYPGTLQESIISQYYDASGTLTSQMIPLSAIDSTQTSWYLNRGAINVILDPNEEVGVTVYNEAGVEVYSAKLQAKESAVINEDVLYTPTIVGMSVTGTQRLADGSFYVYEKQALNDLGIQVTLVYDDGTTSTIPIDGAKCILYGQNDFISAFSGMKQYLTVKYYRSGGEGINVALADVTGSMISTRIAVTVVPNTLGTTNKIMVMPTYNASTARYVLYYYMYFGDGRSFLNVTPYVTFGTGTLNTTSAYFGVPQTATLSLNMAQADPTHYPVATTYQQTVVMTFFPPTQTVRWTIRDATTSQYIYGQDLSTARRPSIRYDRDRKQYFIPSYIFGNVPAFLNSFYTMAAPPYDPTVAQIPQTPTHFILRDLSTGIQIVSAPIPVADYSLAFNIIGDTTGAYANTTVAIEFINVVSNTIKLILFGAPVNTSNGSYITPAT